MLLHINEPGQAAPQVAKVPAIGIDLGTTHTVVAVARGGQVTVLTDADGRRLLPSVVNIDGIEHASTKRRMGSGEVLPVQAASMILAKVKHMASVTLAQDITQAVITVPAYFDDTARQATKDAAALAGLDVLRLINEPTAAALAYGLDAAAEGIYVIVDLGGGTFDVSVLNMQKGVFQVIATGGDTQLGGDDVDQALYDAFLAAAHYEQTLTHMERQRLQMLVREAKEKLSTQDGADVFIALQERDCAHRFMRDDLDRLLNPILRRCLAICEQVLTDAKVERPQIAEVVLVGGATRMPAFQAAITQFFGRQPLCTLNPDEVVAMGAAYQAAALTGDGDSLLLDVTPLSLGIETMGGLNEKIIHRNSPIPCMKQQVFTTYQDGQTALLVHVVQGERELVADCRSLATFTLQGIPPMLAGAARVAVTFSVDVDGLLTVSAVEETTGIAQQVAVKPSYGLDMEAMRAMLYSSLQHGAEDMNERLLINARVAAQQLLQSLETALVRDGDVLNMSEYSLINERQAILHAVRVQQDRTAIVEATEALEKACEPLVERRLQRALSTGLTGQHVDTIALENLVKAPIHT